jgi:AcrR family transcriptional regulator
MFFDPADYLAADPAKAESAREAERLRREAEQRAKLCEATTRLAAEGGLEAAAIHLAARSAGIGQGTYYKLYDSREACLREAFERCAEVVLARVEAAAGRAAGDSARRLEAGLGELLALLGAHPDVAQLLLVEIFAGDDQCRESRQRWLEGLARLLASCGATGEAPSKGSPAWLAAGAVASVLTLRLCKEGAESLPDALGELVWVGTWLHEVDASMRGKATASEEEFAAPEATQLARDAARTRVRRNQREQIVTAMSQLAGAKGYSAVRMSDLLAKADISSPLFYTHFQSKEECLLAAFDAELPAIEKQVAAAVRDAEGCARRAESGLEALLGALAAGPWRARLVTVEVKAAGKSGEQRYAQALLSFVGLIGEEPASEAAQMTASTIAWTIAREVDAGRAAELEALLPELLFATLAPYIGGEKAARVAKAVGRTYGD